MLLAGGMRGYAHDAPARIRRLALEESRMIDLNRPLSSRIVADASVYPTMRLPERPNQLLMGVFDGEGTYLPESVLDRRSGEVGAEVPRNLYKEDDPTGFPEGIYCGVLYFHFGHFLLESIARLWYAKSHPGVPLIWAGAQNWYKGPGGGSPATDERLPNDWVQHSELLGWQREMLDILGVDNPVAIVTRPTHVTALHMPEIGYRYDDQFHPQHAAFLASYHGPEQDPDSRLWLSRSGIGTAVRDLNAPAIERRLERAGWDIRFPERQSLREQLDQMARASVIAGEEGSAFHLMMLLDDISAKRFEIIRRMGTEHRNMHTVGDAFGVNQQFTSLKRERILQARGRYVTKVSESSAEVLDLLQVPIEVPEAPRPSSLRLAEVLQKLRASAPSIQRVLALSVRDAVPLTTVGAGEVTVVSEYLDADPRLTDLASVAVYEMSPPLYFSAFEDNREYDAIVLDGADGDAVMRNLHSAVGVAGIHALLLLTAPEPGLAGVWHTAARILDAFPGLDARAVVAGENEPAVVVFQFCPRGEPLPLLTQASKPNGQPPAEVVTALRPISDLAELVDAVTKARREREAESASQAIQPATEDSAKTKTHGGSEAHEGYEDAPRRRSFLRRVRDRLQS